MKLTEEQIIIIDEWCTHLEMSGAKQIKGGLKQCDGHCCLGILSEMAVAAGVAREMEGRFFPKRGGHFDAGGLLKSVQKWSGVMGRLPTIEGHTLSTYNDKLNKTFPEIAKIVREALLS